jgi:signal peptidase II
MFVLVIFAALALLFDQTTKHLVLTRLAAPIGGRFFYIRRVDHYERMYDQRAFRAAMLVIWCSAACASVLLLCNSRLSLRSVVQVGAGCALGGAAGNMLDVLRRKHIVDFIDLGWWPVFNLADVAIVGGLLLAFFGTVSHL